MATMPVDAVWNIARYSAAVSPPLTEEQLLDAMEYAHQRMLAPESSEEELTLKTYHAKVMRALEAGEPVPDA